MTTKKALSIVLVLALVALTEAGVDAAGTIAFRNGLLNQVQWCPGTGGATLPVPTSRQIAIA